MNSPQQPVETALKHDVTTKGEEAPRGQFDELKNSAIERGHCAMGRDQIEIGLEQIEQVEGAEREASGRDPHEQECEPRRPVEQPVEQLQKRHRLPLFPALDDNRPLLADVIASLATRASLLNDAAVLASMRSSRETHFFASRPNSRSNFLKAGVRAVAEALAARRRAGRRSKMTKQIDRRTGRLA